jgi:hypothetical protein
MGAVQKSQTTSNIAVIYTALFWLAEDGFLLGTIVMIVTPVGTYQESCPLGVLELRTSMQLTSICALGSSWSWNVRHLIVVYSGG